MISVEKPPLNELAHFGVMGMKWGVRKNQPSTRQLKLETKYIAQGLSKDQASEKASRRIRTEKVMIAIGAITLASAAVVVARNQYAKNWTDTTIQTGSILKRMAQNPDGDLSVKTFVSFLPQDNAHYEKLRYGDSKMYQVSLKTVNQIVAPSHHKVNQVWTKVVKENANYIKEDPNIRQFANTIFSKDPEIARSSIGVIPRNSLLWDKFSSELKKSGYNAVIDYTDFGGTQKPMILLDAMRDVLNIESRLVN